MSGIALIGTDGGKRRFYFEQAAAKAGIPVVFLDWKDVPNRGCEEDLRRFVVKIDAPEWESSRLCDL